MALPKSPLERIEALCVGKGVDLSMEKSPSGCKIWEFGGWRGSLARMTQASRGARADAGECDSIPVLASLTRHKILHSTRLGQREQRSITRTLRMEVLEEDEDEDDEEEKERKFINIYACIDG